jgi:hypothetical protein
MQSGHQSGIYTRIRSRTFARWNNVRRAQSLSLYPATLRNVSVTKGTDAKRIACSRNRLIRYSARLSHILAMSQWRSRIGMYGWTWYTYALRKTLRLGRSGTDSAPLACKKEISSLLSRHGSCLRNLKRAGKWLIRWGGRLVSAGS